MSLIAKAQVLQHRRMEALRKYVEDVEDIDRRRDELDLATTRAWVKVVHAGWATTDLARSRVEGTEEDQDEIRRHD